jgi:uncharacterized integral membrane protein
MIALWVVGYLFTLGFLFAATNEKAITLKEFFLAAGLSTFLWPAVLGVLLYGAASR